MAERDRELDVCDLLLAVEDVVRFDRVVEFVVVVGTLSSAMSKSTVRLADRVEMVREVVILHVGNTHKQEYTSNQGRKSPINVEVSEKLRSPTACHPDKAELRRKSFFHVCGKS